LTDLAFNGVALSLVIDELLLLCRHQLWIIFGATKTWATQANAGTMAECPI
jgi:hypothetical protein